jgi:nitrite reductase/ring-hydroxylating ferredoxin subunit
MSQEELGRRALLLGTGCAALALLGACKAEPEAKQPEGATAENVLVEAANVPVGGGVLTEGGMLVLQLEKGQFTAFDAKCPHLNYLVRPPDANGIMVCSGHQSKFRASDGARVDGPAVSNLSPRAVKLSGSNVVLA